jgi:hypothetical protein
MPAWQANQVTIDPQVTVSPLDEDIEMKPLDERIDYNKLMLGLAILGVDVIAFIYLSTAGIKRHFDKQRTISHF